MSTAMGLDTSIVVRLLVGMPLAQFKAAKHTLETAYMQGTRIIVTDLVCAEAYHALHYHYGVPKNKTQTLLRDFLTSGVVEPDPKELIDIFTSKPTTGFVDRMIHVRHQLQSAQTLTFDERQARLKNVKLLRI